jgi:hypothetical protein
VTILGPLAGEPPEPMTREQFDAARKRIRESWNGSVTLPKADSERLVAEIRFDFALPPSLRAPRRSRRATLFRRLSRDLAVCRAVSAI